MFTDYVERSPSGCYRSLLRLLTGPHDWSRGCASMFTMALTLEVDRSGPVKQNGRPPGGVTSNEIPPLGSNICWVKRWAQA